MKLTTKMLKKMIMEEMEGVPAGENEKEAQPSEPKPNPASAEKEKVNSTSKLKAELVELSRNITKIPGLDPNELDLISGMLASLIKISSSGSSATIMRRLYNVLQKNIK